MKLLILGGTVFLGRHVARAALDRGHDVTLLNRGRHGAALFPEAARLLGDRDADMGALAGRRFDATIDCSGYTPDHITRTAAALGDGAGQVVFVSSISVYDGFAPGRVYDESSPVQAGHEGYGALKARAEDAVAQAWPGHHAIVRPGLIAGPYDPTGRFTYWPCRVARGGDVLAPGRPARPVQFIDARDLAAWCVHLGEQQVAGVFNAIGPRLAMAALLDTCRTATGSDARWRWMPDERLLALGVEPWTGLPLWLPESDPRFGGMLLADLARAHAAGLRTRAAAETVADTLAWASAHDDDTDPSRQVATLTPEREAECLATFGLPSGDVP